MRKKMSSRDEYNQAIDQILAIDEKQVKFPDNIPVGTYVQEADNLYEWCREDKETLTAQGLPWEFVTDLPMRAGALREAEARWNSQRFNKKEAAKKWDRISPGAYELRDQLLQYFRFAFRKDHDLMKTVKRIAEGNGHADLIQDLNDLSVLGRDNTGLLGKINFDMNLLDEAAEASRALSQLLAEVNTERMEYKEAKGIRDRAYTHLKEAVDEIYDHGQFAFRGDEERLRGYRSNYMFLCRRRNKKKAIAKEKESSESSK
jgi:hypothetical protein